MVNQGSVSAEFRAKCKEFGKYLDSCDMKKGPGGTVWTPKKAPVSEIDKLAQEEQERMEESGLYKEDEIRLAIIMLRYGYSSGRVDAFQEANGLKKPDNMPGFEGTIEILNNLTIIK